MSKNLKKKQKMESEINFTKIKSLIKEIDENIDPLDPRSLDKQKFSKLLEKLSLNYNISFSMESQNILCN